MFVALVVVAAVLDGDSDPLAVKFDPGNATLKVKCSPPTSETSPYDDPGGPVTFSDGYWIDYLEEPWRPLRAAWLESMVFELIEESPGPEVVVFVRCVDEGGTQPRNVTRVFAGNSEHPKPLGQWLPGTWRNDFDLAAKWSRELVDYGPWMWLTDHDHKTFGCDEVPWHKFRDETRRIKTMWHWHRAEQMWSQGRTEIWEVTSVGSDYYFEDGSPNRSFALSSSPCTKRQSQTSE